MICEYIGIILYKYMECNMYRCVHEICVKPEKFQFLEKGKNRNFDYKIVISVKNMKFIL